MNKCEFLAKLRDKLFGLPQEDIEKSLGYYSEMIDDRIEDGMSEAEAVSDLGDIDEIASQIIGDAPLSKLLVEKAKAVPKMETWKIVLLILSAPIWLSILFSALSVVGSILAGVFGCIIGLYALTLAFGVCAIAGTVGGGIMIVSGSVMKGLFLIGCGISCLGVFLVALPLSIFLTKWIIKLLKMFFSFIKRLFMRKGAI